MARGQRAGGAGPASACCELRAARTPEAPSSIPALRPILLLLPSLSEPPKSARLDSAGPSWWGSEWAGVGRARPSYPLSLCTTWRLRPWPGPSVPPPEGHLLCHLSFRREARLGPSFVWGPWTRSSGGPPQTGARAGRQRVLSVPLGVATRFFHHLCGEFPAFRSFCLK